MPRWVPRPRYLVRRSALLPDPHPARRFLLHSRRARGIAAVALLVGGASLAAASAGAAALDGDDLSEGPGPNAPGAASSSGSPATSPASSPATSSLPRRLEMATSAASPSTSDDGPGAVARTTPRPTPRTTPRPTPRTTPRPAAAVHATPEPVAEPVVYAAADGERIDAERIRDFLAGRGSPLADQAETFVAAGIAHDVDPRVVVGIAIAESNGGERLPAGTHNAWGWGGSGPHGLAAWGSWEESIHGYTELLGQRYETDDVSVEFARTYCPPNWRWWHETVTWAVGQI